MPVDGVVVSDGSLPIAVHPNGDLVLIQIPSLNDDVIHELLEVVDRLHELFLSGPGPKIAKIAKPTGSKL
jgi:hypothetical protein